MARSKELAAMLTSSDVARLLNIHINTVRRWSNEGKLRAYRIGSRGDRRFQQSDIGVFLAQKTQAEEQGREWQP
jgi:excisionase family DNA binding protein